ncbi:MAG: N-methyl-L-tryptophan oxidase [Deltaproteobacteria bacterium]|nr:MAG: N-methyl-L-tryptophan oxidase [Deltaproteobacteria bacterium]
MPHPTRFDVVVLGGGLNGLATTYHLSRMGCQNLAVFEQFGWGHKKGSSHGEARITRSAYHNSTYAALMKECNSEAWPQLESDAGRKLIVPHRCCIYGPTQGPFSDYAEAVVSAGADVIEIDHATARQRFPALRFYEGDGVLDDKTAGLVAAEDTMTSLLALARKANVHLLDQTPILRIEPQSDGVLLHTADKLYHTERLVVTAGAWATRLLPSLASRLNVSRQIVMYFALEGLSSRLSDDDVPIWGYLAADANPLHYSMPSLNDQGIKIARHMVEGLTSDPDAPAPTDHSEMVEYLRAFLQVRLHASVQAVLKTETCLYTNTVTEDFILDHHPEHPMITIGTGFSGHGFKFGPLTGKILAELCLEGKSTVQAFSDNRSQFQVAL